jgi:hypothetical protein
LLTAIKNVKPVLPRHSTALGIKEVLKNLELSMPPNINKL